MYTNFAKTVDFNDVDTWEDCYDLPNDVYQKIAYVNNYYYAFYKQGLVKSHNGIIWKDKVDVNFGNIYGIATITGKFVYEDTTEIGNIQVPSNKIYGTKTVIISEHGVYYSYDMQKFLIEPTTIDSIVNTIIKLVSFKNQLFALTSTGVHKSSDGINWEFINIHNNLTSIDANADSLYIVGNSGLMYRSEDGETFNIYENEEITGNINLVKAKSSGVCYVCSGNQVFITDMLSICNEVGGNNDFTIVNQINETPTRIYISTNNFLGTITDDDFPMIVKNIDISSSELGVYSASNYLFSVSKKQYIELGKEGQFDADVKVFEASESANETIIKAIVITNNNDEDAIYYDSEGNELDGTGLIRCFIKTEDGLEYRLIPDDYELDINDSLYVIEKALILNRGEKIYFSTKTPKISITIFYVYGV